ncbi:MAG: GAF domain-containing protein [Planctomycetia bacterium]|nr:GAF domain-containing protein [Planctomycetia bacterium]
MTFQMYDNTMMERVYKELLTNLTPEDIIRFELNRNSIMRCMTDGCAIVTRSMTPIWANERFIQDFPNTVNEIVSEEKNRKNILSIMNNPAFSYMDEDDEENQHKNPNPFSEFLTTNRSAKSVMSCKGKRTFEVEVHQWTHPLLKEDCMLFVVHDATKRQELKNQLKNIHEMCDGLSHIDSLREYTSEQRWDFLKEGILCIGQDLLHYEFLELRLYAPETDELRLFASYGLGKEALQRTPVVDENKNGTIGYVATTCKTYICHDTEKDPHYLLGGVNARSSMTVPILFQGELVGILNVESSNTDAFEEEDKLYGEILAHEIANVINILRLLDSEKVAGIQMSVEEIHRAIAPPCRMIEEKAAQLFTQLHEDQIEAMHALYEIILSSQELKRVIFQAGQQLAPQIVDANYQELVDQWGKEFNGKQILLLGTGEENQRDAQEFFTFLGCELHCAQTGEDALTRMKIAQQNDSEYYAILCTVNPPDYEYSTQFFIDLAQIYGENHPPLVLLQELCTHDKAHTITNVRLRYPGATASCYPFIGSDGNLFNVILQRTHAAVENARTRKPYFLKFNDYYNDPYGRTAEELESEME